MNSEVVRQSESRKSFGSNRVRRGMCGIVGIAGHNASQDVLVAAVQRMAERIAHRGPDGGGTTYHPEATLGMRRLAIVDVEHGHQPMLTEDGSVALVFNGEIYNAPALRSELASRGVVFRTRSDTEVILRLYEQDPELVEEKLAGMWAFALYDSNDGSLVQPTIPRKTAIRLGRTRRRRVRAAPGSAAILPSFAAMSSNCSWTAIANSATSSASAWAR